MIFLKYSSSFKYLRVVSITKTITTGIHYNDNCPFTKQSIKLELQMAAFRILKHLSCHLLSECIELVVSKIFFSTL